MREQWLRFRSVLMGLLVVMACLWSIGLQQSATASERIPVPPFVDDPAVIGSWRSVDFVSSIDQFIPGQKKWKGDLYLEGIVFFRDGIGSGSWRWSKGYVWDNKEKNVGKYEFSDRGQYLFLEWINDDVIVRGDKPSYYVLERGKFRGESADTPSNNVSGRGEVGDFSERDRALNFVLANCGCALLSIAISVPLVLRKVPMNIWYGFRIKKAFMSDELWYDINAYGGKQMILGSLGMIAASIGSLLLVNASGSPITGALTSPLLTVWPLCLFTIIAIVRTLIYAARK